MEALGNLFYLELSSYIEISLNTHPFSCFGQAMAYIIPIGIAYV